MPLLLQDPAPLAGMRDRRAHRTRTMAVTLGAMALILIALGAIKECSGRAPTAPLPAPDVVSSADALARHVQAEEVQLGLAAWLWDTAPDELSTARASGYWLDARKRLHDLGCTDTATLSARLETAAGSRCTSTSGLKHPWPGAARGGSAGRSPVSP